MVPSAHRGRDVIEPQQLRNAVPSLRELSARALRRLALAAVARRFPARGVLFRAGDAPTGLFFVLEGRVRVVRRSGASSRMLHYEGIGGVLGEIPLFGGGPYPATATAETGTRCAVVSAAAVERLLREEPEFARFALARTATRARVLLERLDELSTTTVASRLARRLVDRARADEGKEFTLGVSQRELAEELDTAREVLVRALRALCESGAIRRVGRARFAVADRSVLLAAARALPPARAVASASRVARRR